MGIIDEATIAYLEERIDTTEAKIPKIEAIEAEVAELKEVTAKTNLDLMGMPDFRKLGVGLREDIDKKIEGVNTHKLTVSDTEPSNPQLNDLWVDIS
jgi:hypothetical protein